MRPITDRLIKMTKAGKHLSRAYVRAKLKAVETRERRAPVHLQRVKVACAASLSTQLRKTFGSL
jgi:hypothetical protein